MRKFTIFAASAALAVGISGTAMADGALYKAKGCEGCHGAEGKAPIMPNYPKIAGQNAAYIEQQIKDIKSGARSNGQSVAMKGIVAGLTDDEIKKLAGWLASK
uniref:Cytochrome c n=1 Tax=Candidatus Kentrum eta TaxID=2126337 RepID=A0A450V025_9GAMM|nr:MAG: cytochrome c [Candidatus Kentron sp. H]VFJ98168.1 MAG: cytochrome c [Candidatus Kentron sp. H]VFK03227.1 MAG: cytochrome c [Candidatus Kentron sp. H]